MPLLQLRQRMKVKLNRGPAPNCTAVREEWPTQLYEGSLILQMALAGAGLPGNVVLGLILCAAKRLPKGLRWVLAHACLAGLFVEGQFLMRASVRLVHVHGQADFCVMAKVPGVAPASCMLEEAPWTAALGYLCLFPAWLCTHRLLCSTLKLRRANQVGKAGVVMVWGLGWLWAVWLIVESRDLPELFYCHNLFAQTPVQRSLQLWAQIGLAFYVLGAYSFVHKSNSSLEERAVNQAIFYPASRIRILDTVAVNRALFPVILLHMVLLTPYAVWTFALQQRPLVTPETREDTEMFGRFAHLNAVYALPLLFTLFYPLVLLAGSDELQATAALLYRQTRRLCRGTSSRRKSSAMLPGDYETAMAALFHSSFFPNGPPAGQNHPLFGLGFPQDPSRSHIYSDYDEPREPEDEDELAHL